MAWKKIFNFKININYLCSEWLDVNNMLEIYWLLQKYSLPV